MEVIDIQEEKGLYHREKNRITVGLETRDVPTFKQTHTFALNLVGKVSERNTRVPSLYDNII